MPADENVSENPKREITRRHRHNTKREAANHKLIKTILYFGKLRAIIISVA